MPGCCQGGIMQNIRGIKQGTKPHECIVCCSCPRCKEPTLEYTFNIEFNIEMTGIPFDSCCGTIYTMPCSLRDRVNFYIRNTINV